MISPPISTNHDVASFATAEHFSFKGCYSESIQSLDEIKLQQQAHIIHFGTAVNILYARNHTQLNNDERARYHLGLISQEVREAYPKIDAEYKTILGILLRRQAYKLFKENGGDAQAALEKAEECLELFTQAKKSALLAFQDGWRVYYSAELNSIYTQGLIALITGTNMPGLMSQLVEKAVIAEYNGRQHMIPMYRENLLGATVIIDLAIGAGHSMASMKWLSDSPEYRVAYNGLFGHDPVDWQTYILLLCFPERRMSLQPNGPSVLKDLDGPEHKPDHIAKILVLGAKILLATGTPSETLVKAYSFELQYIAGVLASNETSPIVIKQIRAAVKHLIERMPHTTRLYLDRRQLAR